MRKFIWAALAVAMVSTPAQAQAPAQDAADPTVFIISYIEATFAGKSQVATQLKQLRDASAKDNGLIRYEVLQRISPTNQFMALEIWKDQQAYDAHVASPHRKAFREKAAPLLLAPIDDRQGVTVSVDPMQAARARATGNAIYVVSHVDVAPPNREKIIPALKALAEASRKDAGNLRFDVAFQKNRTNHFKVIETWKDQKADEAHEGSAYAKEFRNTLTPLTGAMYDQRWYKPL
jgi:quinol monooxygenase YgiN